MYLFIYVFLLLLRYLILTVTPSLSFGSNSVRYQSNDLPF